MYKRYFEIIKRIATKDTYEEVTLSKRNLDALTSLKQQYQELFVSTGDLLTAEQLESFTFDDLVSLLHAGFSEKALDKSAREVVSEIDKTE